MGGRQSWVRKMLNAANLGWVATYSLRNEKGAKKEVAAGARQPAQRLGSGRIRGPGGHRPGASHPQPEPRSRHHRFSCERLRPAASRPSPRVTGREGCGRAAHRLPSQARASPPHRAP